ncbi:MAG: hypothetical protein O2894_08725 [Planctomycetota bacterium]|nr:hypothetical protein [Planctomycetota bacterium]
MDSKTFEIPVAEGRSTEEILASARDAARGAGIALSGDETAGRFEGTATGNYTVDEPARIIRVEVTAKPGFVPWGLVEGALRKVFG